MPILYFLLFTDLVVQKDFHFFNLEENKDSQIMSFYIELIFRLIKYLLKFHLQNYLDL